MELMRLSRTGDYVTFPSYMPDEIIEGYSSLIWTERYRVPGEFELKTPLIQKFRDLLPEGSLIAIRESRDVMMVETHAITKNEDGSRELTITGRSLDMMLQYRLIEGVYGKKHKMKVNLSPEEAAGTIIWDMLVNYTFDSVVSTFNGRARVDAIPGVVYTGSPALVGTRKRRWVQPGPADAMVKKFLRKDRFGLRVMRPIPNPGSSTVVSFNTSTGGIVRTNRVVNELRFHTYKGVDRTVDQTAVPPVIFHYTAGHLTDLTYLFSIKDFINQATVFSGKDQIDAYPLKADGTEDYSFVGLDRRVLVEDAGAEIASEANSTTGEPTAAEKAEFLADLGEFGEDVIKAHERTSIFNGQISPDNPWVYGTDYELGDRVTLKAEYGLERNMRITEYIRSEDQEGDRGWPAMAVDE